MKRIILILTVLLAMLGAGAYAQKTCVIASAENHVPIREALIHTNNNHWARTDYRGYGRCAISLIQQPYRNLVLSRQLSGTRNCRILFLFAGCQTIRRSDSLGQKSGRHQNMEEDIQEKINSLPTSSTGIGFDAFGWMDKQGKT